MDILRSAGGISDKAQLLVAFSHLEASVSFRHRPVPTVHLETSGWKGLSLGDKQMWLNARSLDRGAGFIELCEWYFR